MDTAPDIRAPETVEDLERYWTEALLPMSAAAGVPPDYPRPARPPGPPLEMMVPVPDTVSEAAWRAAHGRPAMLLALVCTASTVLLHRANALGQVAMLTPVAQTGFDATGTNRWLVVKNAIDAGDTVSLLFDRVRTTLAEAFAHQQFPFARVLDLLGRTWSPHRAPVSDIAVAFDGLSRMDVLADVSSDLTIIGRCEHESLRLTVAYRGDLFAVDTIRAFGHRLVRVLATMLDSPSSLVRDVPLLTADEAAEALARWGRCEERRLSERRVEDLIEARAHTIPDAIAFEHGSARLTYGDLVGRARALARLLSRSGVTPGDRVAIALDAGLPLPVAVLGTLFCGAAFVPLDPRHPPARLQSIVAQVRPTVLLAEPRVRPAFDGVVRVLDWDPAATAESADSAAVDAGSDRAPAYVMFTSGSTGEPSGVVVSHRALVNYLLWARDYYLGDDRPAFALYSSIAFDLTLTSVFLPLVSGCTSVIFTFEDRVVDMHAIFADPRVGVVKATPSHLKLLRLGELSGTRVRRLIVGGEAFDWDLAAGLQTALGDDAAIFNEYGPTETTIGCTAHRFDASERPRGTVSIGRPIWNTRIYLLDEDRRPTPSGMAGEIWISGVPLADGYFDRPERTHARFIDDPFTAGQRMYASGDRARADASGRLYCLGRADEQAKLNGVRVELSEVRAALNQLPRVRESVVRVVEDERRNQVLIAYYVARQTIDVSRLRAGLLDLLPQEMMPQMFVRLARLPLTLNGKVDVDRLPSLDEARRHAPQLFVEPRTETEKAVAEVWREVLGVGEISVHSNFFELGGHSLLASQVAWKTRERLGVEMPLRVLFDAPTIARVSAVLDERLAIAACAAVADGPGPEDAAHHG